MTFVDFDIFHRMASMRKLYYVTLTNFLKAKIQNLYISETVSASTQMCGSIDICHRIVITKIVSMCRDQNYFIIIQMNLSSECFVFILTFVGKNCQRLYLGVIRCLFLLIVYIRRQIIVVSF